MPKKTHQHELKKQKFEIKHASAELTEPLQHKTLKATEEKIIARRNKKSLDKTADLTLNVVSPSTTEQNNAPNLGLGQNPSSMGAPPTVNTKAPQAPQKTSTSISQGQKKVNVTKVQAPSKRLMPLENAYVAVQKLFQQLNTKLNTVRQLSHKAQLAETKLERRLVDEEVKEEHKLTRKEAEQETKAVELEVKMEKAALKKSIIGHAKAEKQTKPEVDMDAKPESPSPRK